MVNGRNLFTVPLMLVFLLSGQISYATETPENVLKKYNASSTFDEASKFLTGRIKTQLTMVNIEIRTKAIKQTQMKSYDFLALPVTGNVQTAIVTNVKFADEKRPPLTDLPMIYNFVKEDNQWKIEWFASGGTILELFTKKFTSNQFHSKNSFEFNGQTFSMESAFASYKEEKDKQKTWVSIKFYPFKFQDRDIEFLKYNHGPTVADKDKPTAIASSIKYPEIRLDILTDMKSQIMTFSLGWNYFEGDKRISMAISPPVETVGVKKFTVSEKLLTIIAEGKVPRNSEGSFEKWNINIVDLPLMKSGF